MGYIGRIVIVGIYSTTSLMYILLNYIELHYLNVLYLILFFVFIIPVNYLGYLFDKAEYNKEKKVEKELKKAIKMLEELKFAMDVSTLVTITDKDGKIIYVNDKFCEISGFTAQELIGITHDVMHSEQHTQEFVDSIWDTISSGKIWRGELKYNTKNCISYWLDTTLVPLLDEQNQPYQFIGIQNDISEKVKNQKIVQQLAFYDSLTGLRNRNSINTYLDDIIPKLNKKVDNLFVLFIDFDRFKSINDAYGHKFGDLMLKKAAQILERCAGDKGKVYRYGGDEFIMILNNISQNDVIQLSKNIINSFSDSLILQDIEIFTTPSIGISSYPKDGDNSEDLLKSADIAMYMAKESGKNTFKFYKAAVGERSYKNTDLETKLRKAIITKQFVLFFQPKIQLSKNQLVGYEALIRWNHPQLGIIPPNDFIPIAEKTGLIKEIGEWVIEEACLKINEISKKYSKEIPIAINISFKQLEDMNFLSKVGEIIKRTGCNPSLLEFEITETVMKKTISSVEIINRLKEIGIKVSIDDFGTGYSNFNLLSEMEIDILKIDRSFIQNMTENHKTLSLIKAIINMGHSLGLKIVAEGVETEIQMKMLKKLKCDIGQGYYFNHPLPFEKILK